MLRGDGDFEMDVDGGGGAIAIVGVGGSIMDANLRPRTSAFLDDGARVSAGRNVEVLADSTADAVDLDSFAGAGGLVGVQAGLALIDSENDASAFVGSSAQVLDADSAGIRKE